MVIYKPFNCRVGECTKCCSHPSLQVPITLPDLYRASVYAQEVEGRRLTISQAYKEICRGWASMPDPMDAEWGLVFPTAKIPCVYLDDEKKMCKIHDTHQLVVCRGYPESKLIDPIPGMEDSPEDIAFWTSLDCMKDVYLTPQREHYLKDLSDLATKELMLTGHLLHNRFQPVRGSRNMIKHELERRLEYFKYREFMAQLMENMRQNHIQERYMDLFGIDYPDYASVGLECEEPLIGLSAGESRHKIGRNDPCPCGSGLKFKKCCGGH